MPARNSGVRLQLSANGRRLYGRIVPRALGVEHALLAALTVSQRRQSWRPFDRLDAAARHLHHGPFPDA
jgi:hypothetical protein